MKKATLIVMGLFLVFSPLLSQSNYENAGADYTKAILKKAGPERIKAFETYVANYPDAKKSTFTKLAYYWLAIDYLNLKNYKKASANADKAIKIGGLDAKMETESYLILAYSYGIKSSPMFNKGKAETYANLTAQKAKANKMSSIATEAQKIIKGLSAPAPRKLTPEQQIKKHYVAEEYSEAISYYKTLSGTDKKNLEIHKVYANALSKSNQIDAAIREFKALNSSKKMAINSYNIAGLYVRKARRDKSAFDNAARYYIEAGLLFKKEGNASSNKRSLAAALYQLQSKYNYHQKFKRYQANFKKKQTSTSQSESALRNAKRELRKHQSHIRRTYGDIQPPEYETQKLTELEKKVAALEAGGIAPADDKEGAALEAEMKKIDKEYKALLAEVSKTVK